jgi:hypothetical protein
MATNTYVALDKITTTGSAASVTLNSINQGYTDLVIVVDGIDTSGGIAALQLQFNGDTASNYSRTSMSGNGSSASSDRNSTSGIMAGGLTSGSVRYNNIIQIMNYSNTTTYKTALFRGNVSDALVRASVGMWISTSAITSVTIYSGNGAFADGSTISLYGIAAASTTPSGVTGGTAYEDASYYYRVFTSSGNLGIASGTMKADVLVVAGGGAGAIGGGGAGGLCTYTNQTLVSGTHTVVVGAGGTALVNDVQAASKGNNSSFGYLTAAVGGGAGSSNDNIGISFGSGGSGGGAGGSGSQTTTAGTGTAGQGNNGGSNGSYIGPNYPAGGGGGAGAAGSASTSLNNGGNGGIGGTSAFINTIGAATGYGELFSSNYYFAGGGGGGGNGVTNFGTGGKGGGSNASNVPVTGATINTGGGGGGCNGGLNAGGNGGSGIVVVRYAK